MTTIRMIFLAATFLTGTASAQFMPEFEPQQVRLKDVATIQTLQEVQLLVTGWSLASRAWATDGGRRLRRNPWPT